jgi:signal transduction histidine kinase
MKLRNRLLAFSSAQLVVFGLVAVFGYWKVSHDLIPMIEEHLRDKATSLSRSLAAELDVALGADDRALMKRDLAEISADRDLRFVEIRDANGVVVAQLGLPAGDAMAGAALVAHEDAGVVRVWTTVALEGLHLGSVAVALDTGRVDSMRTWSHRLGALAILVWLVALGYSLFFARSFVAPIQAMQLFASSVANAEFRGRLVVDAPGELGILEDHLNAMTAKLHARDLERAEEALRSEKLQRELLTLSRKAGMAEVATGVLHNVGNVLNSLNVSVSLVKERLGASKLASLVRTVDLVGAHPGGMAAFLSTDKGKLLPQFLSTVSQRLVEEQTQVRAELDSVVRNVDHIKTIVETQQSYSRVRGVRDEVVLSELLDDALRMDEGLFAKHKIAVVRDYETVPVLVTDRHKVLQILVNLVANARQAICDSTSDHPRLTARVSATDRGVAVAITDTGVGIPNENLSRIFQHGFTTKANGHGFGLHASGNTVRELGGSIEVSSAGPGLGACFVVQLPFEMPQDNHAATN